MFLLTVSILSKEWMRDQTKVNRLCSCMWPGEGANELHYTPQSPPMWPHDSTCRHSATGERLRCGTLGTADVSANTDTLQTAPAIPSSCFVLCLVWVESSP